MRNRTRINLLTTGGTIASRAGSDGLRASDGPESLLAGVALPEVDVTATEVVRTGGYALADADLRAIARAALDAARSADGVVITHGTDTMEETAFLTSLVWDGPAPIIFTGAQRDADAPDGDGQRNLGDAVRLAADPRVREYGVMISFAGRAWPARHAIKAATLALDAFAAPDAGPLAYFDDDRVRVIARPPERPTLSETVLDAPLPRVDLISAYAGADGALVRAACAAGARGIVAVGFGTGNIAPGVAEALSAALADGVAVLVASRCPSGPTSPRYGGPGGAIELARAGAAFAGAVRPSHARLLLAAALAAQDPGSIAPWTGED